MQTAFVPKTHADTGLFLLLQTAELSREWQINCGDTIGREEGVRPRGSSSGLQGNETTRCKPVLDGTDRRDLEWKLQESTLGNDLVEQSSDEQGASIPADQEDATQSERLHRMELWKNLRSDCADRMMIAPKKLERALNKLNNVRGSPEQITANVLKAVSQNVWKHGT